MLVLLIGAAGAAQAATPKVLTVRCDLLPDGVQLNVYRNDLRIDLVRKTVQVHTYSTLKDLNDKTFTFRNHRADANVIFDIDRFVRVLDDRVEWGNGSPRDGLANRYYFQKKVMTDMGARYRCTEQ